MDARIRVVMRLLQECSRKVPASAKALADSLGMSETQLRRLFKRDVGTSLVQYLRNDRHGDSGWIADGRQFSSVHGDRSKHYKW